MTDNENTLPEIFELDGESAAWLDVYNLASAKIKELTEHKANARDKLVELAKAHDAGVLTVEGRQVASVREKPTTSLDTTAFKAAHPKLYEKFAKRGTTFEFRVK